MKTNENIDIPNGKTNTNGVIPRWLIQVGIFLLIMAASLFISAGRLNWVMAWVYLVVVLAGRCIVGFILIPNNPELVADRTQIERSTARGWDRPLTGIVSIFGPVGILIVAGLDVRFEWSPPILLTLQLVGLAIAVLGSIFTIWAMASNRFFYGFVRIKKNEGHTVATGGPYKIVRHPGYVGGILFTLVTPLFLGTLWAYIPAGITACAYIIRTALEDKTLQEELGGYEEYAKRVRYRLLPGVW